jgi:hypothetical protein
MRLAQMGSLWSKARSFQAVPPLLSLLVLTCVALAVRLLIDPAHTLRIMLGV